MLKKLCVLIIVSLVLVFTHHYAYAIELSGKGYGKTEFEAKKSALADLSSAIQIEVQSEFESIEREVNQKFVSDIKQYIKVKSDLPILGASYKKLKSKPDVLISALLRSEKAIPLYQAKLRELALIIKDSIKAVNTLPPGQKHATLQELLVDIDQFNKYSLVALMLGAEGIPSIDITRAEVMSRIKQLEASVGSVDLAARIIAKGMDEQGIYVYPPTTRDSHEVTQLGSVIRDKVSAHLNTVQTPQSARYTLNGSYEIAEGKIELVYYLVDRNANTVKSRVLTLAPESYKGYQYKPQSVSFDKLLHEGLMVSNDFRVELASDKGTTDLLYRGGEEFELVVKANRAGYFYLVGHVIKKKEKYSYLMELQEGQGDRKFIYFINADDANKWISLGAFDVVKPFGVESLQMIASTDDLMGRVPKAQYDRKTELYIIDSDPAKGVTKTRALKKKKSKKALNAENVLMFTTMEK